MNQLFFELIRIAIGTQDILSYPPSAEEWKQLYDMAKKQSLVGICFPGVQHLTTHHPSSIVNLSEILRLKWMGMAAKIQQRNEVVNRQCVEIHERLAKDGLQASILKGQGIAQDYPEKLRLLRQSGDIDVWVKGGFETVNDFVQRTSPTKEIAYHRFHYNVFPDTEVELHFRPTLMRNLFDNRKLQKWCDSIMPSDFELTELGFNVPPSRFNKIFLLTHIYRHFLFEGVGLRQVMDYYFVLQVVDKKRNITNEDHMETLSSFGLLKFAGALMWVMGYVFALKREYMICNPDEEEGRFLLEEIMQMGNFGKDDNRYKGDGKSNRFIKHWGHLMLHYPSEVVWSPLWIVYHWFWKKNKLRSI